MADGALITAEQREELRRLVEGQGWQEGDFEFEQDAFDQRRAEVEARKGEVGVRCLRTEAVKVYPIGDGSDWVEEFGADLKAGRFGRPGSA